MDIGQLFRLDNKTAFITGASSGIGKHCAVLLSQAGAKVAIASRRIDQLQSVVDEITYTLSLHDALPIIGRASW